MGRQPWIVQGLLTTSRAVSTNLSTATIAASLAVFVLLYTTLGVVDFVLMRRYARTDPPPPDAGATAVADSPAAVGYGAI
jgi:cytochrome d ubiquinol oxidase subunit I